MIPHIYELLFEHIHEKCRREHWYGPNTDDPDRSDKFGRLDQFGRIGRIKGACPEPRRQLSHPQRFGFASPPATEQELRRTEDALGYPLPAFLRALYTTLTDGGFGPAYGLINTYYLAYQRRDEYVKIELAACPVDEEVSVMYGQTCWSIPSLPDTFWGERKERSHQIV